MGNRCTLGINVSTNARNKRCYAGPDIAAQDQRDRFFQITHHALGRKQDQNAYCNAAALDNCRGDCPHCQTYQDSLKAAAAQQKEILNNMVRLGGDRFFHKNKAQKQYSKTKQDQSAILDLGVLKE